MTRLGLAFLRVLFRLLSGAALARLGEAMGMVLYGLAGSRRRVGETNLRLCFPALSAAERRRLLKAHFRAAGRASLLEAYSWWGSQAQVEAMVRVEGLEHFQAHLGSPMILLAPHFLGLNLGGVRLTTILPQGVSMYAPIKNRELDRLMLQARTRFHDQQLVSRHEGIKPILRAVKQGRAFYYLPDLDYGRKDAVFIPFFGVPAATITGLPRLARATGAVVVPAVTLWENGRYTLRFFPPWQDYPSGDVEADTRRMNAFIEDLARQWPEQYFWLHKRFKTRPEGAKGVLYGDD